MFYAHKNHKPLFIVAFESFAFFRVSFAAGDITITAFTSCIVMPIFAVLLYLHNTGWFHYLQALIYLPDMLKRLTLSMVIVRSVFDSCLFGHVLKTKYIDINNYYKKTCI